MYNLNKYANCLNFLQEKNTQDIIHSHSNFFNHLIGVFNILRQWKQSEDLCFAGMFHNIYGNQYFDPNLNVTRDEIKNLIGEKSEQIAYDFHHIDRDTITNTDNKEQIVMMLANDFDQNRLLKVIDHNFDKKTCCEIENYFFENVPWQFNGHNETNASLKWSYQLKFESDIEKNILNNQEFILRKTGLDRIFKLSRVYASANQFGHYGELHTDDGAKEYNEKITLMYYLNSKWDISWAGETSFLNENNDEILRSIIPKPGRAILFDGFIKHGSRPLNKVFVGARMVLTFKYELR